MLLVGFAVFMGAFALSLGTGDDLGATLTWWAAMFDLMFLIIVVILLIITIAFLVLSDADGSKDQEVRSSENLNLDETSYDKPMGE
jgi:uncharacterized membrane protein